jgi:2-oxoglutarate ferredoxin oxidoreductase subunit beta
VNVTILRFNNRIYGLTKGQYCPRPRPARSPGPRRWGSLDHPFNPVLLALSAETSFVARTIDSDRRQLPVLAAAAEHRGASLVEIY